MRMKQSLIVFALIFGVAIQIGFGQSLSAFYTLSEESKQLGFAEGKDYSLTSASKNTASISFDAVSEFPVDLKFEFTTETRHVDNSKFTIQLGNSKKVDVVISKSERSGMNSQVYINGEKQEYQEFWVSRTAEEPKGMRTFMITVRLNGNNLGIVHEGEMGAMIVSQNCAADSRALRIESNSLGKTSVKVVVDTENMPKLSCFAKAGLKIRSGISLKSEAVGRIPFGKEVYILEKSVLESGNAHYFYGNSTEGDLQVEDLSSKMVKVLYGDKVGYAYGGYLIPLRPHTRKGHTVSSHRGWNVNHFDDEVYHNGELVYKKVTFDFSKFHFSNMAVSQRSLLARTLFPDLLTKEKIAEMLQSNDLHRVKKTANGMNYECRVFVEKNEIMEVVYTAQKVGLKTQLSNISKQYVIANNLNMRASKNTKSDILTKIALGEAVKVIDNSGDFQVLGGVRGKMIKVSYNGKEGYVFDAYLSPIAPVTLIEEPRYDIYEVFSKTLYSDKFEKWKHDSVNKGSYDQLFEYGEWEQQWMVVPSRDKFQALKTLRTVCPFINDVSFKWNEAMGDYEITGDRSKRIEITGYEGQTYIIKYENDEMLDGTAIWIEQIDENLYKVSVVLETPGC